jgi:hypothetical protein
MPVEQMLHSTTSWMGVLLYLGRYFQALSHPYFGKLPVVCIV